ncbi:hypothetical protein LX36DRAFT_675241 [Colletotrichum falcatum]|nr:hypothetical protein LX36DRAFT_675241 [Colletotrichum falcatum]
MPATITVLYPNEADAKYDFDYYVNSHLPMAAAKWKSSGCKSWSATKYHATPDGKEPKYSFAGILVFESIDAVNKALASAESPSIMQDVPNYSNKQPVILVGDETKTAAA